MKASMLYYVKEDINGTSLFFPSLFNTKVERWPAEDESMLVRSRQPTRTVRFDTAQHAVQIKHWRHCKITKPKCHCHHKKNQWQGHVAKSPRKPESNSYQGAPNPSNLDDEKDLEEEVEKEERVFIMLKTIMMMSTISMQ